MAKIESKAPKKSRQNFRNEYRTFIDTGKYNLPFQHIPQFLNQLITDIAVAQGMIEDKRNLLKNKKLHPLHPMAVKINKEIEQFKDDIEKFRKRKKQLIKLREKPSSKKPNQIIVPLARPMIKDTGDGNEN